MKYKQCCMLKMTAASPAHFCGLRQVEQLLAEAAAHLQSGQLATSESFYRQVIAIDPNQVAALIGLGQIAFQTGYYESAAQLLAAAADRSAEPTIAAVAALHLGQAYTALGRIEEAALSCSRAISLRPDCYEAHHLLGRLLQAQGRFGESEQCYRAAVTYAPNHSAVHLDRGCLQALQGNYEAAVQSFLNVLRLQPDSSEGYSNLGNVYQSQGRLDEAYTCFQQAVAIRSDFALAHYNLGNVCIMLGRLDEAVSHLQTALNVQPGFAEAYNNLGNVLQMLGRLEEAIAVLRQSVAVHPEYSAAKINLGVMYTQTGDYHQALQCFNQVLSKSPDVALAQYNKGIALIQLGCLNEAIASLTTAMSLSGVPSSVYQDLARSYLMVGEHVRAIELYQSACQENPHSIAAAQAYLCSLNYLPTVGADDVFLQHKYRAEQLETKWFEKAGSYTINSDPDRRLRIGYVSGDFRQHAVCNFIEPVLMGHDRGCFEVFCYANQAAEDGSTQRLKRHADGWRSIYALDADNVAEMIRNDGIDMLIDLSGHTPGNALEVFAHHPAPIQITWLGYATTTGLSCIDYRIVDHYTDPVGMSEQYHTETLWRLPDSFMVYQEPHESPAVSELPVLSNNYITFGSFNNFAKINSEVIRLWAQILIALPTARLMIKAAGLDETEQQQRVWSLFAVYGITKERLVLFDRDANYQDHLARYGEVDIALDTFPYNGGTTSLEGLWMGVPVLTLAGERFASRIGVSIAHTIGLTDWIADTPEEYVSKAVGFSCDPAKLHELRRGMRGRLRSSPLMNTERFTGNLEAAYRGMWKRWCMTIQG